MNNSRVLHFLLFFALGLGQIASNVHVVGHVPEAANHAHHHLSSFTDGHQHNHSDHKNSGSTEAEIECAAYHAFAGLAGIQPTVCNVIALHSAHVMDSASPVTHAVSSSAFTRFIRGPPVNS